MQVTQQDTPQAFGASLWGGRKGEPRIEITVVANSIEEVIAALQAAAKESEQQRLDARDEALRSDPCVREALREGNEALARGESTVYESGEAFRRDFQ